MESVEFDVDGVRLIALRESLCVAGSALHAMVERCDIRAPIVLPGFRPEVVAILLNWLAVNRLTRRPEGASSASPCRHARGPASPCEGLAEQVGAPTFHEPHVYAGLEKRLRRGYQL